MSGRASRALGWMVVAVCLGLVAAAPASAQIYAIRDENGVLTLSDKPLGAGAQTYAVRGASSTVRATRGSGEGVRSSQWDDVIDHHAREQGLRPDLVRAVIQVESAFNPRARSHKGAMGLMQLMPATARELGVRNAYDPLENIRGGTTYLRGSWPWPPITRAPAR
jgi:soluble lytic murein transglycosylase-like protein